MQYRVAILGKTRLKQINLDLENSNKEMQEEIDVLELQITNLENTISGLQSQITQLQSDLADAQALAQLRAQIILMKNGYIQDLQTILDNNGIPYPPEPVYPS